MEQSQRKFTIRFKGIPGSLVDVVDRDDIEVAEICPVCYKQGIIWRLHPDTTPHKGSPHFKPRQRLLYTILKHIADTQNKENV